MTTKRRGRVFEQVFLKPGRYAIGDGRFADLTPAHIRAHVENTRKLIAAGYAPPVLFAHARPGAAAGAPRLATTAADKVKNGAGWLEDVRVDETGAAIHRLRITNADAANRIAEGSVRFASPELRPSWEDGRGTRWENIISHMALTHKPRNSDQSDFVEVGDGSAVPVGAGPMQYSLDRYTSLQLGDDEDDDEDGDEDEGEGGGNPFGSEGAGDDADPAEESLGNGNEASALEDEEEPEPDMPEPGSAAKRKERLTAIIAHLDKRGVGLPEDTADADIDTLLDRLLTALLTANKFDEMESSEASAQQAAADEENQKPQVVEQRGIGQFSLDDKKASPMLRKVMRYGRKELKDRLDRMVGVSKIGPSAREAILAHSGALQFSADGSFRAVLSIPDVVALLEKTLVAGAALEAADLDVQFDVEGHPDGEKAYQKTESNGLLSPAEAAKLVESQGKKVLAGMFRS